MTEGVLTLTRLTDRLAKAEVYQSLQFSIAETLVATTSVRDAMPRVLRAMGMALNWELGMYWQLNKETNCLSLGAVWQSPLIDASDFISLSKASTFCAGDSLPGRVWVSGTSVWLKDFPEHGFLRSQVAKDAHLSSAIAFPIYSDLEAIGVIEFFSTKNDEEPDNSLLEVLVNIGYRIGQFSKRRYLEQRVLELEARYHTLADSAYNAVIVANSEGIIEEWSIAAELLFGWKKSEAIGRNLILIIPERFRAAHLAGISRIQKNDHTFGSRVIGKMNTLEGLHKDGSEFPIDLALSTWNTNGKRYYGAIVIKRDNNAGR
jgi:PAS domain S-box-containing protein